MLRAGLTNRALVCCVQATELLGRWEPIDVEDALRLLSPDFTHSVVREFAVRTLSTAREEDLISYLLQVRGGVCKHSGMGRGFCCAVDGGTLCGHVCPCRWLGHLQLVQALRYETMTDPDTPAELLTEPRRFRVSPLADFLVNMAVQRCASEGL